MYYNWNAVEAVTQVTLKYFLLLSLLFCTFVFLLSFLSDISLIHLHCEKLISNCRKILFYSSRKNYMLQQVALCYSSTMGTPVYRPGSDCCEYKNQIYHSSKPVVVSFSLTRPSSVLSSVFCLSCCLTLSVTTLYICLIYQSLVDCQQPAASVPSLSPQLRRGRASLSRR